ncbi:UNVERIFIED_CONTAM: hypothetical protein Slati_2109400 [Sesamum latifolium]|uniref:RNase H type-1 domain-containing protein n=1 Tax=Sesamum latifolium TaxID=2727402 RepID=A0AAW2WTK3_9LAMI
MENLKHMLLDCTFARLTWALSDLPWHGINLWSSCEDWMWNMSKLIDKEQSPWFLSVCWALWTSRNKHIMENEYEEPMKVIQNVKSLLAAFQLACSKSPIISVVKHPVRWERPSSGFVKINFDVAIFQQPKGAGAGILCRDPNGSCIDWLADFSPGVSAADHAEAIALRKGVGW